MNCRQIEVKLLPALVNCKRMLPWGAFFALASIAEVCVCVSMRGNELQWENKNRALDVSEFVAVNHKFSTS